MSARLAFALNVPAPVVARAFVASPKGIVDEKLPDADVGAAAELRAPFSNVSKPWNANGSDKMRVPGADKNPANGFMRSTW
jgi:hypothetical protein